MGPIPPGPLPPGARAIGDFRSIPIRRPPARAPASATAQPHLGLVRRARVSRAGHVISPGCTRRGHVPAQGRPEAHGTATRRSPGELSRDCRSNPRSSDHRLQPSSRSGPLRRDRAALGALPRSAPMSAAAVRNWSGRPLKDRASEAVSLRRFDWRFLLPLPPKGRFEHLVVLGTPTSAAARLKELNLSDRLSVNPNVSAEADAVVVLAGAAVPPSAVAAFVQPGGLVYWEIDRRASLAWTPGRLRRAMRNVGLFATSTYWVVPHHAAPRKFVPLDCAAAIRWYFDTSFVAGSPRLRLLRAIMRVLGTFQGGIDRFVPCYSMVATAGPVPAARPRALAAPGVPPAIAAEDVRPVVLTSGRDAGSRVVVLPLAQGRAEPSAVLKLARDSAFSEHTMREQMTLGYLRERLSPTMKSTLPAALGMKTSADSDASPVAVESYASGSSLQVSTAQWGASSTRRLADLHRASDWITRFHEETVLSRAPWGPEQ